MIQKVVLCTVLPRTWNSTKVLGKLKNLHLTCEVSAKSFGYSFERVELLQEIGANIGEVVTVCGAMQIEYYLITKASFEEEVDNNVLRECLVGLRNICKIDNIKKVAFSKNTTLFQSSNMLKEIFRELEIDLYLQIN